MSKVVVLRFPNVKSSSGSDKSGYVSLLENGLMKLTEQPTASESIRSILSSQTIGLKTNCLTRKFNSTPVALTDAVTDILTRSGYDENDVIVWERTGRELEKAGYKLNASSFGRRCLGTDANGIGYSGDFYSYGKVNSLVSKILIGMVDSNINLPVLKDHSIAGLSASLKNMYGAINNPNKYHGDNCNPFAAHVSNLEPIKEKNQLTIIDAIKVQYHAGPGYDSRYIDDYGGLIISQDPVAADRIGLEILEYIRKRNNMPSLEEAKRPASYLKSAEEIGLGIADLSKINLKVFTLENNGQIIPGDLKDG